MDAISLNPSQEPASCDEIYMNDNVLFSDGLKDLKNLRKQLYSAAEYFELSYANDDQKDIVVNTLKDYAMKAIVNTVDHLGAVSYKVNDFLDTKVVEVSGTELLVSCIEQRVKSCQEFIDREGLSQQSSVMNIPKYHKRYILPVGEAMNGANGVESTSGECSLEDEDEWRHFKHSVQASSIGGTPPSRVGHSPTPSSRFGQQNGSYSVSIPMHRKESEKGRASSNRFPLLRSESVSSLRTTPKKSRPITPNPSRPITLNPSLIGKQEKPSEPQRSFSMRFHTERFQPKESENNHGSKTKRLLKALLSRRKSKRDDMLYTYLDEY